MLNSPKKSYGYQMNMGMDAAKGQYMAILETDDYILPEMYEELYTICEDKELDMVKADFRLFVGDGKGRTFTDREMLTQKSKLEYETVMNPSEDFRAFRCNNVIWTGLYSMDFLRGNEIRFHESAGASYQDNGFWFLTMSYAKRMLVHQKAYYMLRRDNPNSSVNSRGKVYCMCDEYDFILQELERRGMREKFGALCARFRFSNYLWNYERISEKFKDEFLERFAEDFRRLDAIGELQGQYFDMEQGMRLKMLMESTTAYKYYQVHDRRRADDNLRYRDKTKAELVAAKNSANYRVGKAILWLPKKVRNLLRMVKRQGIGFAMKKVLSKLGLAKAPKEKHVKHDYNYFMTLEPWEYRNELIRWYKDRMKADLNLDFPKTFNEKVQWLKLYDITPLKTMLADKYQVRDWVAGKIGEEYLVPLLGVWDRFDDIDFDALPEKFVLKTNHGCASNYIVKDKSTLDRKKAKEDFDKWLSKTFAFQNGLELHYMNIPPKIIAEQYLENGDGDLKDYKVFCFNGKAEHVMYLSDRRKGLRMAFYDLDWNKQEFTYSYPRIEEDIPKPANLDKVIRLAEELAQGFAHVRVDFYILDNGDIRFGEMTFTSASGALKWSHEEANQRYGDLIRLPFKSPVPRRKV